MTIIVTFTITVTASVTVFITMTITVTFTVTVTVNVTDYYLLFFSIVFCREFSVHTIVVSEKSKWTKTIENKNAPIQKSESPLERIQKVLNLFREIYCFFPTYFFREKAGQDVHGNTWNGQHSSQRKPLKQKTLHFFSTSLHPAPTSLNLSTFTPSVLPPTDLFLCPTPPSVRQRALELGCHSAVAVICPAIVDTTLFSLWPDLPRAVTLQSFRVYWSSIQKWT
jgi:hypothetical protein